MIGWQELLVIFLIVLLLFGARKLPELAKGFGSAIKEFKKASANDPVPKTTRKKAKKSA